MTIPVLVVGGGPVGLTLSVLLTRQGIDNLVIEARAEVSRHPKARGIAARSMEIFRRCELEKEIRAAGLPPEHVAFFRGRTLTDPDHVRTQPASPDTADYTPSPGLICSQDALERVLSDRVGARLRRGVRLLSFRQQGADIVATLSDTHAGTEFELRARWLVGCDGARSTVRAGSGIGMRGPTGLGEFLSVRFEAPLGAVVADRASASYFLARGGGFMAVDNDRQWIYQHPLDAANRAADLDAVQLIRSGAGIDDLEVTVHDTLTWRMDAQLADSYRHGRVLLAGDAAHTVPPTGGHGMNVGIGDADNLAWKLAAVLGGRAGESLLDTYESERRPVARQVIDIASDNARRDYRIDDQLLLGANYAATPPLTPEEYRPSVAIGARLPHAWLPDGSSTLDLVGVEPVVLAGSRVPRELAAVCGLSPDVVVTVRPDGHIGSVADPAAS